MKNEHVLALVSLQAENDDLNKTKDYSSSVNSEDELDVPIVPKFTRQKAKQLNKKPLGFGSLKKTEPDSEVVALIQADLPEKSDDEDEEYVPGNDEIQSDEDQTMTTISDLDSQPSTPGCSLMEHDVDIESLEKDSSGLFKVPKTPTVRLYFYKIYIVNAYAF